MECLMTWGQEIPRAAEHLRETAAEVVHLMDEKTKALLARTDEVRHATTDALASTQSLFDGISQSPAAAERGRWSSAQGGLHGRRR